VIAPLEDVWVRSRVAPGREGAAAIERVGPLTPYLTQTIVEDAVAGGPGTSVRLELWGDDAGRLAQVRLRRRIALLAGSARKVVVMQRTNLPGAGAAFAVAQRPGSGRNLHMTLTGGTRVASPPAPPTPRRSVAR
jgi:hypothetical protein